MKFSEIEYQRPDLDVVENKLQELQNEFDSAEDADEQSKILLRINELQKEVQSAYQVASIRHSIDTNDKLYEEEQQYYDVAMPKYSNVNTDIYRSVSSSKFKNDLVKEFGEQYFRIAELSVKTNDSTIIEDLQEENQLSSEYTKVIASAMLEFEGKEFNLSGLGPFVNDTNRERRKNAVGVKTQFFADNQEQIGNIFHKMVQVRHRMAQRLGYKNFVPLGYNRMIRSDYSADDIKRYRDYIEEFLVPFSVRLREKQRQRLGLDSLKNYDLGLMFKDGNPKPKGNPDWIIQNGKKMYEELSPETKEFFYFMLDNEMMDLVNKKGKAAGGYCTMISKLKSPFIFSNFNGTTHDIDVLTHEAGHAFQVYSSRESKLHEYYFPTYEACEIHSMSMEFFTQPWMHLFFQEDANKYKYHNIAGAVNFIPYGAAIDEFQHEVYENPQMSPADRNATWRNIEKKYQPYKDYDGNQFLESGGFWMRQLHVFKSPFYYIDYTLAQVCAFQFLIKMEDDFENAWKDYVRLCKIGGSKSFVELVEYANLKSPFDKQTMKETIERIEELLTNIEATKL